MADPRRLPIYLVLDTSGSMMGDPISAVQQGLNMLLSDLNSEPSALETAYLSVITFNSTAQQVVPLTAITDFRQPPLEASGTTAFGAALAKLEECLARDVVKGGSGRKGDWRPLVFVMTDGQPTDTWEPAAARVKAAKVGNVIACAAGGAADEQMLKKLTDNVVKLNDLGPDALKAYFKWVSSTVTEASRSAGAGKDLGLPPPPTGDQIVVVP